MEGVKSLESYWLPTGPGAIAYFHLRHRRDRHAKPEREPVERA
jgi:hypothetical protein